MTASVKIRVAIATRATLKLLGRKGESYDALIRRLIELHSKKEGWPTPEALKKLLDIEEEVKKR